MWLRLLFLVLLLPSSAWVHAAQNDQYAAKPASDRVQAEQNPVQTPSTSIELRGEAVSAREVATYVPPLGVHSVYLKDILRDIKSDGGSVHLGRLPLHVANKPQPLYGI